MNIFDPNDFNWRLIIAGLVVDWLATFIVSMGLAVAAGTFARGWRDDSAVTERATQRLTTPRFLFVALLLGTLCTILGGSIASSSIGRLWWSNALVVGVLSLGIYLLLDRRSKAPRWYRVLSSVLVVPSALLGGWLRVFAA